MNNDIGRKLLAYPSGKFVERCSIQSSESCWNWLGAVNRRGYGVFAININGKITSTSAQAASFVVFNQIVPSDLFEIDHTCRNTRCVNPQHLELVSLSENQIRGSIARGERNVCRLGHPKEGVKKNGHPYCKVCKSIRRRKRLAIA